jgi:hypothetical protein
MAQPCRCSEVPIVVEDMCSVVANTGAEMVVKSVEPSRSAAEVVAADSVRRSVERYAVDVGLVWAAHSRYSCKTVAFASVAECGLVDRVR